MCKTKRMSKQSQCSTWNIGCRVERRSFPLFDGPREWTLDGGQRCSLFMFLGSYATVFHVEHSGIRLDRASSAQSLSGINQDDFLGNHVLSSDCVSPGTLTHKQIAKGSPKMFPNSSKILPFVDGKNVPRGTLAQFSREAPRRRG